MSTAPGTDCIDDRARPRAHIVVGIVPGQPAEVLATAAAFAARFDADLVLAYVDDSRFTVEIGSDGTVVSLPIDPDLVAEATPEVDPDLHAAIAESLDGRGIRWIERVLAGGPAHELDRLAEEVDAAMIVVGVRKSGLRASLHEFVNGSVAIQLAHHQPRPLVVVPLKTAGRGGAPTARAEADPA